MSRGTFYKGVALGAVVSVITLGAQAAYAGTGIGAVFNLGRSNAVSGTSTLTGTTPGAQLQVTNKSTSASATGVSITVNSARPPIRTNSKTLVANLNSNYLQGKRASDFLAATGTAADASKLGGVPAAEYVHGCPLVPSDAGPVGGSVAARAIVKTGQVSASLTTNGVIAPWSCTGGAVWAQRFSTGLYCVVVDPAYTTTQDGWTYAGRPTISGLVVPVVSSSSRTATVSLDIQLCGAHVGEPGFTQYIGFIVSTWDRATGDAADGDFSFALL